ncbi:damage-control phosphatase ARMT1 [Hyla sarda]|uniref:damage-control phosphatase ARMT1 n=1 Tax=Hyla sarda TaxID=327740 RepID=UPI0024C3C412|nr:damage-control phosphatase ARMT1 [Hyla sarda]XP_056373207.1 damage-control phosphatase ARMT1 [Hyla sarda]XP_056373208.1 damage-control phosphatase ARMT1 [Hyla sarda]XP_056373209.1 damage-control phosphatase ARMT1 [Hyla sarda]
MMETPDPLSAKYEGSFAYYTVKDRLPQILTKVIDNIHRNKNKFLEAHGEEGIEAEKKALSFFSKLRNEMQTDKPMLPLSDELPDVQIWNQYLDYQRTLLSNGEEPSWFKSPWLYVECYMYRRIQEGMALSPPISDYDVFRDSKNDGFFQSQQAMLALCTHLQEMKGRINSLSKDEVRDEIYKLLQVSLWGNKCDLSVSGGQDNSQTTSVLASLEDFKAFILVDDTTSVWNILSMKTDGNTGTRVDFVLDNAGFELITDLVLADAMLSLNLATEVHFHGKVKPWYVSDTTKHDFDWTVRQCLAANNKWMSKCGQTWKENLKKGRWVYHEHLFWTLPHEFCTMAEVAPDLYTELQKSDLVLFKGDLNYRKLTGDRKWDFTVPFSQALRSFHPAPLCSIRTLKADVQVGLPAGVGEQLAATETDWLTTGKYGVIQFSPVV